MSGTKAIKESMLSEYQIKGYWWLPKSEHEVSGILFYSKETIRLELLGTLNEDAKYFSNRPSQQDVIFGFSEKGEKFSLLSSILINSSFSMPGYQTETYDIQHFVVGEHFNRIEEIKFHSVSFGITYLTKWIGNSAFDDSYLFLEDEIKEKHVKTIEPSVFKVEVPVINATIKEDYTYNIFTEANQRIEWIFQSFLKIVPNEQKDFEWYQDKIYQMRNLLTLLIGYSTYFESITFYGEEKTIDVVGKEYKQREKYKWFFKQRKVEIREKVNLRDFMVSYQDIKSTFPIIINSWFEKQELLNTVYDLYINDFYSETHLSTSFLNLVQSIEIFHRRTYNGKLFDEKLYEEHSKKVLEFIESNLPVEFQEKFHGMVKYGNEYSLSKRFREINKNLLPETKSLLFGNSKNRDRFIQQLVDTRNYLTHYDKEGKKYILDEEKRFYAIKRLKALVTILLFKEIGVSEIAILNKIKESKQFSHLLNEANRKLNK